MSEVLIIHITLKYITIKYFKIHLKDLRNKKIFLIKWELFTHIYISLLLWHSSFVYIDLSFVSDIIFIYSQKLYHFLQGRTLDNIFICWKCVGLIICRIYIISFQCFSDVIAFSSGLYYFSGKIRNTYLWYDNTSVLSLVALRFLFIYF